MTSSLDVSKFTDKQLRWAEEYPKHFNATRAARDAGYSPESARDMGYQNKQNPALMALVDERHRALTMSADEATRHLSDMAATRLNDFLVIQPVQGYEMTEQYVTVLLTHARNRLKKLEQVITKAPKNRKNLFSDDWAALQREILGYEADIEQHGDGVSRLVPWRPVVKEIADLDLPALARAHGEGRIKSFSHTKEGTKVETYAADAAAREVLKLQGRYEKHNRQKHAEVTLTIGGRSARPAPGTDES